MKQPRELSIDDFSYELPDDRIAYFPALERDASRLLLYRDGKLEEDIYRNIHLHLPEGALLVFNNTRVIPARLYFPKPTGSVIELFLLEPEQREQNGAGWMEQQASSSWKCLLGKAGRWKEGQVLEKDIPGDPFPVKLRARLKEKNPEGSLVDFSWEPASIPFSELLQRAGKMPLPPYLKRAAAPEDQERYQTVFSLRQGSVAAPTAGLHFTEQIFASLDQKGIRQEYITLHVGAGTFLPVKSATMEGHLMHEEFMEVSTSFIRSLLNGKPVYCVGTTSLRTVESLYWMGVKCFVNPSISYEELAIRQWEVYDELDQYKTGREEALEALLSWMDERNRKELFIKTAIMIAPGYRVQLLSGLITNFHQPRSTLLLLIAALIGDSWRELYQYALDNHFRFLSYGDGCFLDFSKSHLQRESGSFT